MVSQCWQADMIPMIPLLYDFYLRDLFWYGIICTVLDATKWFNGYLCMAFQFGPFPWGFLYCCGFDNYSNDVSFEFTWVLWQFQASLKCPSPANTAHFEVSKMISEHLMRDVPTDRFWCPCKGRGFGSLPICSRDWISENEWVCHEEGRSIVEQSIMA